MENSIIGWAATFMVVAGFIFNSQKKFLWAIILWILGDLIWIVYDLTIKNYSHLALSLFIVFINIIAYKNHKKIQ